MFRKAKIARSQHGIMHIETVLTFMGLVYELGTKEIGRYQHFFGISMINKRIRFSIKY